MSIQQSINQGINVAGALYTQTGSFKTKQELKSLETQEQKVKQAMDVVKQYPINDPKAATLGKELYQKQADIAKERFRINPTERNAQRAFLRSDFNKIYSGLTDIFSGQQDMANAKTEAMKLARDKQREAFTKYMKENYTTWQNQD